MDRFLLRVRLAVPGKDCKRTDGRPFRLKPNVRAYVRAQVCVCVCGACVRAQVCVCAAFTFLSHTSEVHPLRLVQRNLPGV